jgi:hypothetical protein
MPNPSRPLKTYSYSVYIQREGERDRMNVKNGETKNGSIDGALEAVAYDEQAYGNPESMDHWPGGGWARYYLPPSQGGGFVSVVAVEKASGR